jgi:hypothetical protein
MRVSAKAEGAVRAHFVGMMAKKIQRLLAAAKFDLYYGPSGADHPRGYGYTSAIRELDRWWDDYGGMVWYDTEADLVEENKPEDAWEVDEETGETYEPPDIYLEIDKRDAKRIVFGALITDGGM